MTQPIMVHIDIETRSTKPNAAIVSIGAAPSVGDNTFYQEIDQSDALNYGISDAETDSWWEKQSKEARNQLNGTSELKRALSEFCWYIKCIQQYAKEHGADFYVVSRAPQFDLAIIRRHFELLSIECPWKYLQERDHRSLEHAYRYAGRLCGAEFKTYQEYNETPSHNALYDALAQMDYIKKLEFGLMSLTLNHFQPQ